MKTVEFKTTDGRTRYYLAGEDGLPVEPAMKFLKFRDAAGYARNDFYRHRFKYGIFHDFDVKCRYMLITVRY